MKLLTFKIVKGALRWRHAYEKVCTFRCLHVYTAAPWCLCCAAFAGRNALREHVINHTNVCLRVWQQMLLRAVCECQQNQRDKERHMHCLMKRDEKSMMCRIIMEAYFCLICAAKTQKDLSASLSFRAWCIWYARHCNALTLPNTKTITYRHVCVCVLSCFCL